MDNTHYIKIELLILSFYSFSVFVRYFNQKAFVHSREGGRPA